MKTAREVLSERLVFLGLRLARVGVVQAPGASVSFGSSHDTVLPDI